KTEVSPDGSVRQFSEGIVTSWFGAGLDWQLGRHLALTLQSGWSARPGTELRLTYGITLGFTFGKARPR
ncbi:MAG TPA: hypothetical protein VFX28_12015, partial [Methylomirabilota bacterium]|nr:hypothetical protein [Methylomirabilota bacterium]